MTTSRDVTRALKLMRWMRDDVEEDFAAEIDELWSTWTTGPRDPLAAEDMADSIATVCHEYGYPSLLGEPPDVAVITPDGPGRLAP